MDNVQLIFDRRHPLVAKNQGVWERIRAAYSGGLEYIGIALIKHLAELDLSYEERKQRAYYINLPRKIARLISHFLLSVAPQRDNADEAVIEDFDRSGLRSDEVMLQAQTILTCYGLSWLLVDMPSVSDDIDIEAKKLGKIRPFCRALTPFSVRDWAYGDDGELLWAIVAEWKVDEEDPFKERDNVECRRVWTRNEWFLYERGDNGLVETAHGTHNLGMVPLVKVEEADGFGIGDTSHWFEDIVRISDAILNNGSEGQMNIIQQMFGLLVLPEAFAKGNAVETKNDEESDDSASTTNSDTLAAELARSAAIWETFEEKGTARYISPEGVTTETIREENKKLKEELFDVVGLALQSSSKSAQTAESKAWDAVNIQQGLSFRATQLEQAEQKVWKLFNLWDRSITVPSVSYNRDFSVKDLSNSVAALMNLSSFDVGDKFSKELKRAALSQLADINEIPMKVYQEILEEINSGENTVSTPTQRIPGNNKKDQENV